ncbi:MAG: 4Fe-4S binding protein, partial [Desulfobacterales bacterium]
FVVGAYEFQVGRMDKEFAEIFEDYFNEALAKNFSNVRLPLRTVPVHKSVDIGSNIAPYRDAREIIKSKDNIALADCICRKQKGLLGEDCDNPREVCFMFGSHADYYVENKLARKITKDEALSVLDKCEEAGLVCQPANSINPGGMCNCCGDCCGILRALKIQPKPSEMVVNNYWASVDPEICTGCETCVDRCQMEAVSMNESDIAQVNTDRCIGCGLCVTTCPSEAMSLVVKPEESRFEPPASGRDLMQETAQKRGKTLMPLSISG